MGYLFIISEKGKKKGSFFTIKLQISLKVFSKMKSQNLVMGLLY